MWTTNNIEVDSYRRVITTPSPCFLKQFRKRLLKRSGKHWQNYFVNEPFRAYIPIGIGTHPGQLSRRVVVFAGLFSFLEVEPCSMKNSFRLKA